MMALFAHELIIGLALGLLIRLVMSGAQVAGTIIGFQSGLSFATSFDPNFGGAKQRHQYLFGGIGAHTYFCHRSCIIC